jgi:hypothetical protein
MVLGYVLGLAVVSAKGLAGATIAWIDNDEVRPSGRGWHETKVATKTASGGSGGTFSQWPRFPAWRCAECKLVEFSYDEQAVL